MLTIEQASMADVVRRPTLDILKACKGYYTCPKDSSGTRLGPLVGYAGPYKDDRGRSRQYVGETYCNFAKAEPYPQIMRHWAGELAYKLPQTSRPPVFLGAPMGGIIFATHLSNLTDFRSVFAEKMVTALATPTEREHSQLRINRHDLLVGDNVVIVEDVCNNFSTTRELIALVKECRAVTVGIACLLNRSPKQQYEWDDGMVPVTSVLHLEIPEYKQDDDYVVGDIEAGNVVWKPKNKEDWARLDAAQREHASS